MCELPRPQKGIALVGFIITSQDDQLNGLLSNRVQCADGIPLNGRRSNIMEKHQGIEYLRSLLPKGPGVGPTSHPQSPNQRFKPKERSSDSKALNQIA